MAYVSGHTRFKIDTIPENIIVEIFKHLSLADVCRVRRVCRSWNRIARDSSLWRHTDMRQCNLPIAREIKILRPVMHHIISLEIGVNGEGDRLGMIHVNPMTDAMMKEIGNRCPKLEQLSIQGSDLRKVIATSLPQTLSALKVTKSALTGGWLQPLVHAQNTPNLKHLSFQGSSRIDNKEVESLCKLFPQLQTLDISQCYRVRDGLQSVPENLLELEELDISEIGFGRSGSPAITLSRILHMFRRNLTKLRILRACKLLELKDLGIAVLPGIKSLEQLYLDGCAQLKDADLVHFQSAKNLTMLSLKNCDGISAESVANFRRKCQNCVVLH